MDTETRLLKLEEQLEKSNKHIGDLNDQLFRQSDIIGKLICGLFNCHTQKNYRKFLLDVLEGNLPFVEMEGPDSSQYAEDPTTSQGDTLEKRTDCVEDMAENLTIRLNRLCLRVADIEDTIKK